ncbi:halocyanin domain-containing protein [Halobacteriales archaeon QS_1_68_20]|nr:MAG: halocyanin domain-containing protein [Halobacteriales archaeon QS_1_68_20]
MAPNDLDRRTFLTTAGAASAVALAGCTGGGDGSDEPGDTDDGSTDNGGGGNYLDDEPDYSDWFGDANAYKGTADYRDESDPTVKVGGGEGLAFEPAAIAVSTGTTVTWEWTGDGGSHNVVSRDDAFESEFSGDEGHTFEYTFEESGTYEYYCDPHETSGMKGVVYVE